MWREESTNKVVVVVVVVVGKIEKDERVVKTPANDTSSRHVHANKYSNLSPNYPEKAYQEIKKVYLLKTHSL